MKTAEKTVKPKFREILSALKNNCRMEDGNFYWDMTAKIAFDKTTGL